MIFTHSNVFALIGISLVLGFFLGQLQFGSSVGSDGEPEQYAASQLGNRAAVSLGALESGAADEGNSVERVAELKRVAELISATIDTPLQSDADGANPETGEALERWPVAALSQLTGELTTAAPARGAPERGKGIETVRPAWPKQPQLSPAAVRQVIDRLPCAAATASAKNGVVTLRGYVIEGTDVKRIRGDLLKLGGTKTVNLHLGQLDEGQCGVMELYAPYLASNRKAGQGAFIKTRGDAREFVEGDPFVVTITTPSYESYVTIDYLSRDGEVIHMLPSKRAQRHQAPANYAATIGDLGEWIVSMPYGTEMVTTLFTPRPLFPSPRDPQEPAAEYLSAVKEQLRLIAKESGEERITADFVFVTTKSRVGLESRQFADQY